MTAMENRLRSSFKYKITLPLNVSIHGGIPMKSRNNTQVKFVTYSTSMVTYDYIKRREHTYRGEPAQLKLTSSKNKERASPVEAPHLWQRRR
jgi:hypothetical protein